MKAAVPTLTTAGWVRNPATAVSVLFDYLLTSEDHQSYFFEGQIYSLPKLVQEHGHAPRKMASQLETALFNLYTRYFDAVRVTVEAKTDTDESGKYNLQINLLAIDGEQHYNLARVLEVVGSKILQVYANEEPQYSF